MERLDPPHEEGSAEILTVPRPGAGQDVFGLQPRRLFPQDEDDLPEGSKHQNQPEQGKKKRKRKPDTRKES